MIGLRRGIVTLCSHNKDWLTLGTEACQKVQKACGNLSIAIEHVGSTSIPGLTAKPIIDLALGLSNKEVIHEIIPLLTEAGFIYRGEGEGSVGFLFVWESEPDVRSIHLHAIVHGTPAWKDYVVFRDILRADPVIVKAYEELKIHSAQKYPENRKRYTATKAEFIRSVLSQSEIYDA